MQQFQVGRAILLGLLGTAAAAPAGAQVSFTPLGDLTGGSFTSRARAVSPDGSVVVGGSSSGNGDEAFRWTVAGGLTPLGDLAGGSFTSNAWAVAAGGAWILGEGQNAAGSREAARWPAAGPITPLGFSAGGGYASVVYAASADGQAACGENIFAPPGPPGLPPPLPITQAMRWTAAGGMIDLGTLPGITPGPAHITSARAMSADGSVVAGYAHDAGGVFRAWRWTPAGGLIDITGGLWSGRAFGVSPDGTVAVGSRSLGGPTEPFSWTDAGGRTDLGFLSGHDSGTALDAAAGGARICGTMLIHGVPSSNTAAVWDRGLGWRSVSDVLGAGGANVFGWILQFAWAMSDDGRVIVGYGINPSGQVEAWRAEMPLPCRADFNGQGGVSVQDIFDFLGAYFSNSPAADINGQGGVTVQDIFDYLALYFVGCP